MTDIEKDMKSFRKLGLRKWLKRRGITEYRFRSIIGASASSVSDWANGRTKPLFLDKAIELALIKGKL